MRRTVIVEFRDNFEFPETYSIKGYAGCPFIALDETGDDTQCFITGDGDYPLQPSTVPCPFRSGELVII